MELSDDDINTTALEASLGCKKSFRILFDHFYCDVLSYAYQQIGSFEEAQDATQVIFVKIARNIKKFRGDSKVKTWVYTVSANTIRTEKKRITRRSAKVLDNQPETTATAKTPDCYIQLLELVQKIPQALREAVVLVHAVGMSHKEAALVLGCKEGTVSWRIAEARKLLKSEQERPNG